MRQITLQEFLMGREQAYAADYNTEIAANAQRTVDRINALLVAGQFEGHVNSGWRPPALNAATHGAAPKSKHLLGLACDLHDADGRVDQWCLDHGETLERIGLWQESPESTPGWCHLQIIAPLSGHRIFIP